MASKISLPLSLDSTSHFTTFLRAAADPSIRKGLRGSKTLPKDVSQILDLIDDAPLLEQMRDASRLYQSFRQGKIGIGPVKSAGKALRDAAQKKYPAAMDSLIRYAEMSETAHTLGWAAANSDVAANAEAVVNAGVYANVAVATNAVIALAAVAVVAVVVD